MKVEEIILKTELTQEEMQFVVEQYIFEKKQRKITINIHNNRALSLVPQAFAQAILQNELQMLNEAYNVAVEYFINKLKS